MSIVLMMGVDGIGGRVADSYLGVSEGTGGGYYLIVLFYLCFCLLFSHVLSVS